MPPFLRPSVWFLSALFLFASGAPIWAEVYRIGAGDRLLVELAGIEDGQRRMVDADGRIRMSGLGGVRVAGLTLDAAERSIEIAMADSPVFVDPRVTLLVEAYAPVLVAGDVALPGRLDFVPGMTVASAIALGGGTRLNGLSRLDLTRARADVAAALRKINLTIASTLAQLARVEASLSDGNIDEALIAARVPDPDGVDLTALVAAEKAALAAQDQQKTEMLAYWQAELRTLEAQHINFTRRITMQTGVATAAADALTLAQDLHGRGLQTLDRLTTAQQRDAEARSRVLELETLMLQTERAIGQAQRDRAQFLARRHDAALKDQRQTLSDLATHELEYQRLTAQSAILSGGLPMTTGAQLAFEILTTRPDRPEGSKVTLDTPLLPGETLMVTLKPQNASLD